MLRLCHDRRNLVIAFWVLAGAMLLSWDESVAAQATIPTAAFTVVSSPDWPGGVEATRILASEETVALAQVTRAEMEPGPTGGGGSYALGALVGAVVAAVAALRERFTKR